MSATIDEYIMAGLCVLPFILAAGWIAWALRSDRKTGE